MRGTFRAGDCLFIEKKPLKGIRAGDIVVFRNIDIHRDEQDLVHRVVGIEDDGLVTRGDNNWHRDQAVLGAKDLIGAVCRFERNGKNKTVSGGRSGLIRARFLRLRLCFVLLIKWILGFPYYLLRKSKIISCIWHPKINSMVFKTQKGDLIKFIHHGRTVARYWMKSDIFLCKKPYDLIINREDVRGKKGKSE